MAGRLELAELAETARGKWPEGQPSSLALLQSFFYSCCSSGRIAGLASGYTVGVARVPVET